MPIHEYDCDACGWRFEMIYMNRVDADAADASVVCPRCNATSVRRLVSPFGVKSEGMRQMHLKKILLSVVLPAIAALLVYDLLLMAQTVVTPPGEYVAAAEWKNTPMTC